MESNIVVCIIGNKKNDKAYIYTNYPDEGSGWTETGWFIYVFNTFFSAKL